MRIGARTVSGLARLCLIVGAGFVLVSCTGESSASEFAPTPAATVEVVSTSTPVATATPRPTATPTPTATATPEPTPTPTGVELYGELLVDGAYTWPVEMPDDLTEDELFAINIFTSAQNADFAAIEAQSANLAEFDSLADYVKPGILTTSRNTIALDLEEGRRQIFNTDGTDLVAVEIEELDGNLVLHTCEHHVTDFEYTDGSVEDGQVVTIERKALIERNEEGLRYDGWTVIDFRLGRLSACVG